MKSSPIYYCTTLVMLVLNLTACTSRFDCPHTAGVFCQSLDQINRRIDAGELPLFAERERAQGWVLC